MNEQELNEFKPFLGILITTDNHRETDLFVRDTFSYRFNRNIGLHVDSLNMMSSFPKNQKELFSSWPESLFVEGDYITDYTNISQLEGDEGENIIRFIIEYPYGRIFVPPELKSHPIIQRLYQSSMPLVILEPLFPQIIRQVTKVLEDCGQNNQLSQLLKTNFEDGINITSKQLSQILKKNSHNLNEYLEGDNLISDKTSIEPIDIPSREFLRPLQILINRNRGLYRSVYANSRSVNYSTIEDAERSATQALKIYLKRLIVERYITFNFLMDEEYILGIIKELDSSFNNTVLSRDNLEKYFTQLSDYFFERYCDIPFRMDMVFVLPMVNKVSVDMVNKEFKLRLPKPTLRKIYDREGYYIEKTEKDHKLLECIYEDVYTENRILDSLVINYALNRGIPFVRLPNLPTKDITTFYKYMFDNIKGNSNLDKISKFNVYLEQISQKLKISFDEELLDMAVRNGKYLKFITDAPVEWITYKNVPLGIMKSIGRLPIIPGNNLVYTAKNHSEIRVVKSEVKFLIINTLKSSDDLRKYGQKIGNLIKKSFPDNQVKYVEVTSKADFLSILNEEPITFLIYYGHGSMPETRTDNTNQVGMLRIGDDKIDMIELAESIKYVPQITILGACQTQVLNSHYLNIGNMFLGLGSKSVLATYFPVDGFYTFSLIESIFRNLKNYFNGEDDNHVKVPKYIKNWADILLQARRNHYLLEPIKVIIEYLKKKNCDYIIDIDDLIRYVMKYCISSSENDKQSYFDIMERVPLYRDEAYMKYFENKPQTVRDLVDTVFKNNYIFPESIIFTSLGSPEAIEFIDGNNEESFYNLTEREI